MQRVKEAEAKNREKTRGDEWVSLLHLRWSWRRAGPHVVEFNSSDLQSNQRLQGTHHPHPTEEQETKRREGIEFASLSLQFALN